LVRSSPFSSHFPLFISDLFRKAGSLDQELGTVQREAIENNAWH